MGQELETVMKNIVFSDFSLHLKKIEFQVSSGIKKSIFFLVNFSGFREYMVVGVSIYWRLWLNFGQGISCIKMLKLLPYPDIIKERGS